MADSYGNNDDNFEEDSLDTLVTDSLIFRKGKH